MYENHRVGEIQLCTVCDMTVNQNAAVQKGKTI